MTTESTQLMVDGGVIGRVVLDCALAVLLFAVQFTVAVIVVCDDCDGGSGSGWVAV